MADQQNWKNQLYFGDNLSIMRDYIVDESVDLVYLDPPFNSQATYNVLFAEKDGKASPAQITAFEDTWHWDQAAEATYWELVKGGPKKLADLMQALRSFLGSNDMLAYLMMMAIRLVEMRRVLSLKGSIYLHCDPTASHYLKIVMDAVFGVQNFRNEIVWKRTSAHNDPNRYGRNTDRILFYTKTSDYYFKTDYLPHSEQYLQSHYRQEDERGLYRLSDLTAAGVRHGESGEEWRGFNPTNLGRHWGVPKQIVLKLLGDASRFKGLTVAQKLDILYENGYIVFSDKGIPSYKKYLTEKSGVPLQELFDTIPPVNSQATERLGFPTQKPEALLERIILASSNEGDIVLDPFAGCGSATVVAERLHRHWIGIDVTHLAITLVVRRLVDTFGEELHDFEIIGDPKDVGGAEELAHQNRHQFEWWALSLVGARPAQDKKKGADRGIDGYVYFQDDESGQARKVVVQVKSGHVGSAIVRDLKGTVEREKAVIGVLITLNPPTGPMKKEALEAGYYEPEHFPGKKYPKLQILTVEDLLAEKVIEYPRMGLEATFKRAKRQTKKRGEQGSLLEE